MYKATGALRDRRYSLQCSSGNTESKGGCCISFVEKKAVGRKKEGPLVFFVEGFQWG